MTVRVALVDSGVRPEHPWLAGRGRIELAGSVGEDGALVPDPDPGDRIGHGTAAAAAILDLAPRATLVVIRVFLDRPAAPAERLLAAIGHAIALGASHVNLSLGTPDPAAESAFLPVIRRARDAGCVVVAPASFRGLASYPGILDGVEGVVPDAAVPRDGPERRPDGGRSWWHASPYLPDRCGVRAAGFLSGASVAAANLTGWMAARTD